MEKSLQEKAMESSAATRNRSGKINDNDPLVMFLYVLIRDHVVPGKIEEIMLETNDEECEYSNGWLACYARDIAKRLK